MSLLALTPLILLPYDENRHAVVPGIPLVQQLNHRERSGSISGQQLGPVRLICTVANDNTSTSRLPGFPLARSGGLV